MSTPHRPDPGQPEGQPGRAAPPPRRTLVLAVTAVTLLAADLLTKVLVVATLIDRDPVRLLGGALYLTHARNPGAAFSFAEGATVLFTAVAAIVVVVIVRTASRLRSVPWAVCLGLILGGAAGNLVDRLFRSPGPLRGHVVDWISVFDPYGRVWPIFNLADSGIVTGGALAVLLAALGYELDGTRTGRGDPEPEPGGRRGRRRRAAARPPAPGEPGRPGGSAGPAGMAGPVGMTRPAGPTGMAGPAGPPRGPHAYPRPHPPSAGYVPSARPLAGPVAPGPVPRPGPPAAPPPSDRRGGHPPVRP